MENHSKSPQTIATGRYPALNLLMEGSIFLVFLGFSALWILMGIGGMIWIARQETQGPKIGTQGLLIGLSILAPFLIALLYGAVQLRIH